MIQKALSIELNAVFEAVCATIQLPPSLHDEATAHYTAIAERISAPQSGLRFARPHIFPFGSMALRTETRPIGREEFDLDQICLLHPGIGVSDDPRRLFDAVLNHLGEYEDIRKRMSPDPPAIVLEYANQFRLEIVPARPQGDSGEGAALLIADYANNEWVETHPKGLVTWFDDRSIVALGESTRGIAASIEPPPEASSPAERSALARAVQMMKRRRDRYYLGNPRRPSSVVFTVLAGEEYRGEPTCFAALRQILASIQSRLGSGAGYLKVSSPVQPHDDLTEQWQHEDHQRFSGFIEQFCRELIAIEACPNLEATADLLGHMFGQDVATRAFSRYASDLKSKRQTGQLGYSTRAPAVIVPAAAAITRPVPDHTFFGGA